MITTTQTSTHRRLSVHDNAYDPWSTQSDRQRNFLDGSKIFSGRRKHSETCLLGFKRFVVSLFPQDVQAYLPEVDIKVTATCLIWYVASSISSNLSKTILKEFKHPVALTELQFLASALLCVGFTSLVNLMQRADFQKSNLVGIYSSFPEGILPCYLDGNFKCSILRKFLVPCKSVLMVTFPMGVFQFVGHISTHKAISVIPVSLVHSIKALSPIITVGYYRFFKGRQYNSMTYYTLIPLIMGVMVTCWASHGSKAPRGFSTKDIEVGPGFFFASLSMLIFVSQNIFAKKILTSRHNRGILPSSSPTAISKKKELSPLQVPKITILFYCSCTGFLLTLPLFLTNELFQHESFFQDLNCKIASLILFHGCAHFLQTVLAFQLIGMLSSVNYSVANIMKRIVIILVALIWESKLNIIQLVGLFMTLGGLYGYDKWGSRPVNL